MEIIKGFTFRDHAGKDIYVREDEDFLLHSIRALSTDGVMDESEKEYGYSINGHYFATDKYVIDKIHDNTELIIQEGLYINTKHFNSSSYDSILVLDLNDIELIKYKDLNSTEKIFYFFKHNNSKEYPLTENAANILLEIVK